MGFGTGTYDNGYVAYFVEDEQGGKEVVYVYPDDAVVDYDDDGDEVGDFFSDNCPETPNGPALGTCVRIVGGNMVSSYQVGGDFITCDEDADCADTGGICQMEQGDYTGSGCGDVCECESNFDADGDVDGLDAIMFKIDY